MDNLNLLIDLHIAADRQGPGGEAETRRAIELSGLSKRRGLKVADIGCGTGASTLVLARELEAQIIAVDSLAEFLEVLRSRAAQAGLADRIGTVNASMDTLPFEAGSLDAIWSEGAIYNIGFESGVKLTPFRGHLILMEEGVRNAEAETSISGAVSPADGRTGASRPHAGAAVA